MISIGKKEYITELKEQLQKFTQGKVYINITQFANAVGIARETAAQMLFSLRYIRNGKEKLFFINEVAVEMYGKLECDQLGGVFLDVA